MPDFAPDGCTHWPDGWWRACCDLHDALYWWQPEGVTRALADQAMALCITEAGAPLMATAMAVGVTLFGWRYWRRGRRGRPGTEPAQLKAWLDTRKERDDA